MTKCVGKRGDTLIEVMLAVGIFSMVAVAVVAVMSGGTSSAQTALETTLTREEIDTQAEALRFIQSSYIAEKEGETTYKDLWEEIINNAFSGGNPIPAEIAQYSPSDCSALYSGNITASGLSYTPFVIDTNQLSSNNINDIVIKASSGASSNKFFPASTYPRLVYSNDNASLVDSEINQELDRVEGIYIIAVKDPNSTNITDKGKTSAYYDFYIRTCWYGTGDKTPSTISTVMRLYDPGIVNN